MSGPRETELQTESLCNCQLGRRSHLDAVLFNYGCWIFVAGIGAKLMRRIWRFLGWYSEQEYI